LALAARPRLVVLRALGLGDLLTAVPALRALERAFPDHERVLAAPAALAPLAKLVGWPLVPARELEPLPPALERPDMLVNLHGCGPESHELVLAARPRQRIWFEHAEVPASLGSPRWRKGEHEVRRWCRLLTETGISADPAELSIAAPTKAAPSGAGTSIAPPGAAPPSAAGATIIHPGAASGARRWPADRFAAVARAEADAGRTVLVTGSRAELPLALEVASLAGLPAAAVLAGSTDLTGLARLVAAAGSVVCGDTGVAHLATALGTPSVVLFGPTSPAEWGPPPRSRRHRALWTGRRGDPHAERPDPGLLEITPADVIRELDRFPDRVRSAPPRRRVA
jgi:ADP-heptose:LPS heptosyltransferase